MVSEGFGQGFALRGAFLIALKAGGANHDCILTLIVFIKE